MPPRVFSFGQAMPVVSRRIYALACNGRLYSPECHSPRQMKLANALCRYREMAAAIQ